MKNKHIGFAIIFGGLAILISGSTGAGIWIMLIGVFVLGWKRMKNKQKDRDDARDAFVSEIIGNKGLSEISTRVLLIKDEKAFLENPSTLYEARSVRSTSGGGAGFRIAKGVGVGGYSSTSRSSKEWKSLSTGFLTLTNKRLLFSGDKESREIKIDKIFHVEEDGRYVTVSYGQKKSRFQVPNSEAWQVSLQIVKSSDDPTKLAPEEVPALRTPYPEDQQ